MENNEDFDYQGKRPDQVEKSNKFIFIVGVALLFGTLLNCFFNFI